jgi:hypothetical protein
MRNLAWIVLISFLTGLCGWIVIGPWFPKSTLALVTVLTVFAAPSLGGIWMLYRAIRFEKHPFPVALLAFIPYGFLWYYFERVRPGKHVASSNS